ncbi:MAG: hypothetical protein IT269_07620 [Saprospiraceae bacterium]|nr:hypothetical protein [Saprospiraceae bacterium]
MKIHNYVRVVFSLLCFFYLKDLTAQRFFGNGLLYSKCQITYLKPAADSMNSAWMNEQRNAKPVLSKAYAIAHDFRLTSSVDEAYLSIQQGMKWQDFKTKYNNDFINENQLISFRQYSNAEETKVYLINIFGDCHCPVIDTNVDILSLRDTFIIDNYRSASSGDGYLSGIYIQEIIPSAPMSDQYASWVQYADFMTGDEKLFLNRYKTMYHAYGDTLLSRPSHDRFFNYIDIPGAPPLPANPDRYFTSAKYIDMEGEFRLWFRFDKAQKIWQKKRDLYLEEHLSEKPEFKLLLQAAVEESIRQGVPDELLEKWAWIYLDFDMYYAMMRLRPGYSTCGNDPAPSERLYEIARFCSMDAEKYWFGFIRAHLGLVNDLTDWSNDDSTRFVGELEAIDLDVPTLLLGTVLHRDDVSKTHYQGIIKLTGLALSQCKQRDQIEVILCHAIADEHLDDYNRIVLYRVYHAMMLNQYSSKKSDMQAASENNQIREKIDSVKNSLPKQYRECLNNMRSW